jgi:hypothetical protein
LEPHEWPYKIINTIGGVIMAADVEIEHGAIGVKIPHEHIEDFITLCTTYNNIIKNQESVTEEKQRALTFAVKALETFGLKV